MKDLHIGEKISVMDGKSLKPAVAMKRYEESRRFIVKIENGKTFRRNRKYLRQIADSNGTDNTILISDGEEENSIEQEVIAKREEVEMDPPHPDNLSNEVTTQSRRESRRPIWHNDYVH